MNWQQLYTASTPEERLELINDMLQAIEARHKRLIIVPPSLSVLSGAQRSRRMGRAGWGLVRERRRIQIAHFINDRRLSTLSGAERSRSVIYKTTYISILLMLSAAVFLVASNIQPAHGAALILLYDLGLFAILIIKPYNRANAPSQLAVGSERASIHHSSL